MVSLLLDMVNFKYLWDYQEEMCRKEGCVCVCGGKKDVDLEVN